MSPFTNAVLDEIEKQIEAKHLLKTPFYLAWSKGLLTKSCLLKYAKQYYHHVKAFPTYLSLVHSRLKDLSDRREVLQNLMDEEGGEVNHLDLWKRFALALGATSAEVDAETPSPEASHLVSTFSDICAHGSLAEAFAILYAYEGQAPAVCISKIEGLKKHYGMTSPEDWKYFSVHIVADEAHAASQRQLLSRYLIEEKAGNVSEAVNKALDALWGLLSSLCPTEAMQCT